VASWYVHVGGSTSGPHPDEHVRHWLANRQLPDTTLFWPDGATAWITLPVAWRMLQLPPAATPAAAHPTTGEIAGVQDGESPVHAAAESGHGGTIADTAHTGQIQHAALTSRSQVQAVTARLADFAGVERITGFRPGELLSLALRNHSRDEVEEYFGTGLRGLTPPLDQVESN
jgi:GYF domain 2